MMHTQAVLTVSKEEGIKSNGEYWYILLGLRGMKCNAARICEAARFYVALFSKRDTKRNQPSVSGLNKALISFG